MKKALLLTGIVLLLASGYGYGQLQWDSLQRRNVIKFNPTPMLLWGNVKNVTISYERLIKPNQSVALQVGYLLFPRLTGDTLAGLVSLTTSHKNGVNVSVDYRYYPFSRNRRPAPDGLYVGGYLSYYGFNFKNNFDILHTTVDQNGAFEGKLNIGNLGFELGYQFLFWKRLSLDLLMFGPSISYYNAAFDVSGNLDESQIEDINKELVDKLLNRFPLLKSLFSGETLTFTGVRSSLNTGFRYSIQVGFAF